MRPAFDHRSTHLEQAVGAAKDHALTVRLLQGDLRLWTVIHIRRDSGQLLTDEPGLAVGDHGLIQNRKVNRRVVDGRDKS